MARAIKEQEIDMAIWLNVVNNLRTGLSRLLADPLECSDQKCQTQCARVLVFASFKTFEQVPVVSFSGLQPLTANKYSPLSALKI